MVPGVGEQPSTEVALRFELGGEPVELDMHVFEVDGEWAWVVGRATILRTPPAAARSREV